MQTITSDRKIDITKKSIENGNIFRSVHLEVASYIH
jgi:hypothetical protein